MERSRRGLIFTFAFSKEMLMKTILPALTSAALLALAGPALAGKSTPQEREVTKQLNLEQAQQAKNTTQQIAAAIPSVKTQSQSAPAAAPTTPVESTPAAGQQSQDQAPANPDSAETPAKQPAQ
jgi:hypothetical protein